MSHVTNYLLKMPVAGSGAETYARLINKRLLTESASAYGSAFFVCVHEHAGGPKALEVGVALGAANFGSIADVVFAVYMAALDMPAGSLLRELRDEIELYVVEQGGGLMARVDFKEYIA